MKTYIYRCIVEKSNPQLIRELQFSAEDSLEKLEEVIAISYGLVKGCCAIMGQPAGGSMSLCDLPDKNILTFEILTGETTKSLFSHVRAVLIEEKEQDLECPRLLWGIGYHIPMRAVSLEELNHWMGYWEEGMSVNSWSANNQLDRSKMVVYPEQINRRLRVRFLEHDDGVLVDRQREKPYIDMLLERKEGELQMIYRNLGYGYSYYSGSKKTDMVYDIYQRLDDEEMDCLFYNLKWEEYVLLKKLCGGGEYIEGTLSDLINLGLIVGKNDGSVTIARELLDFYENWVMDGREETQIFLYETEEIMVGGCVLYGVITRSMVEKLYRNYYPGKEWKAEEFESVWTDCSYNSYNVDLRRSNQSTVYYYDAIKKEDISALKNTWKVKGLEAYIPTLEEIKAIAKNGCRFPEEQRNMLVEYLKAKLPKNYEQVTAQLEMECYMGYPEEIMLNKLRYGFSIKDRDVIARVQHFINWFGRKIRQFKLNGHTQEEVEKSGIGR